MFLMIFYIKTFGIDICLKSESIFGVAPLKVCKVYTVVLKNLWSIHVMNQVYAHKKNIANVIGLYCPPPCFKYRTKNETILRVFFLI